MAPVEKLEETFVAMKQAVLALLRIGYTGRAGILQAQGTVLLNNYDARMGIYMGGGPLAAPPGTFVEIFGGWGPGAWSPLVNSDGQGPVFQIQASGVNALGAWSGSYFDAGQATVSEVAPAGQGWFAARAWYGAASFDATIQRDSEYWQQPVGTPTQPAPLVMPRPLYLFIPEPSAAALAGLAVVIFGLLGWRKRTAKPRVHQPV